MQGQHRNAIEVVLDSEQSTMPPLPPRASAAPAQQYNNHDYNDHCWHKKPVAPPPSTDHLCLLQMRLTPAALRKVRTNKAHRETMRPGGIFLLWPLPDAGSESRRDDGENGNFVSSTSTTREISPLVALVAASSNSSAMRGETLVVKTCVRLSSFSSAGDAHSWSSANSNFDDQARALHQHSHWVALPLLGVTVLPLQRIFEACSHMPAPPFIHQLLVVTEFNCNIPKYQKCVPEGECRGE